MAVKNPSESEILNLMNYSFIDYKYYFNQILQSFSGSYSIIDDLNDFWMFVNKYESLLKKSGRTLLSPNAVVPEVFESLIFPGQFHKQFCINFSLKISYSELNLRNHEYGQSIDENKTKHFFVILLHYLDFKQKEKFKKLKYLRKFQNNLPVAKFRSEILKAVEENQIVIVAGDTGCGKSTQVPQYLKQKGFGNIGNYGCIIELFVFTLF